MNNHSNKIIIICVSLIIAILKCALILEYRLGYINGFYCINKTQSRKPTAHDAINYDTHMVSPDSRFMKLDEYFDKKNR